MSFANVLWEVSEGVATLTLNRPKQLNALDAATLAEIGQALDLARAQPEDVRALIVTGAGEKAFVAGADIAAMSRLGPGEAREFASLGHRTMVSDLYWLSTVQYIGDNRSRQLGLPQVFPLVDLITELDPGHCYAYQAAGLVLSSLRLQESDAILKKGMEGCPDWWSYPFYLAFNDYYYRGDYPSAARWAERAARTPGARPSISRLALALKVKSGAPDEAVRFIEEMRATVDDERLREALDEQYREALLQRDFAALDAAVARFQVLRGRAPARLEEVVAAGLLDGLPTEPYGGRYELRDGKVHSTGRDFRVPPAEPGLFEKRKAWDKAKATEARP